MSGIWLFSYLFLILVLILREKMYYVGEAMGDFIGYNCQLLVVIQRRRLSVYELWLRCLYEFICKIVVECVMLVDSGIGKCLGSSPILLKLFLLFLLHGLGFKDFRCKTDSIFINIQTRVCQ